jgi:hypothetical protein
MVYNTQILWVFGLCLLSSILETRKHSVSETGPVFALGWRKTPTLLAPLERASLNRWTRRLALLKGLNRVGFTPLT